jgi:anaerobic ribonucleoside-triphosphate reductase activating protein
MNRDGSKPQRWPEPDGTPLPLGDGEIRLAGPLQSDSIVDGEGLRAVLWTQGCRRKCPGCQNPETWDVTGGIKVSLDFVKDQLRQFKGQAGLTFSGGEPLLQPVACRQIADWARTELGWNIWSFSGYTYEQLKKIGGDKWDFVKSLDVLIDGPFILAERDLSVRFRGSRNQRLLRLKNGEIMGIE